MNDFARQIRRRDAELTREGLLASARSYVRCLTIAEPVYLGLTYDVEEMVRAYHNAKRALPRRTLATIQLPIAV
jgi:hypothetical protein